MAIKFSVCFLLPNTVFLNWFDQTPNQTQYYSTPLKEIEGVASLTVLKWSEVVLYTWFDLSWLFQM